MKRNFPAELLDLEAFLLWQPTKTGWTLLHFNGTQWVAGTSWKDRQKHTLRWLIENTEAYIDNGFHVAMVLDGTGYACLDFDYSAYAEAYEKAEDKARFEAGKIHMDSWLEQLKSYTYCSQSKTPGNFHCLLRMNREARKIKDVGKRPIDFIGQGLLILTGYCDTALPIAEPEADDLAMIEQFFPFDGGDVPFGSMNFGGKIIELAPTPHEANEDGDFQDLKAHLIERMPWYMTGQGDAPRGELHALRMNLMVTAAEWAYGMPSANEFVWQALWESYLPTYHAQTSEKNRDRFTNQAKIRYMQRKEVAQAMGIAHSNLEPVKLTARANVARTLQHTIAKKAAAVAQVYEAEVEIPNQTGRKPPVFPTLPDAGLFKLVKEGAVANMIGPAAPLWQDIHTLWLTQHVISHYTWASGTRMCPQALVSALSGTGKSAIDDLLLDFETAHYYGQNKRAGGSIGSGAGIRAALKEGVYTTVTSEECGSDLKRIFSADAKGHDRDARETMIQAINKRIVKPHLLGQSNAAYSETAISGFMYASHLATQPHNIVDIVNEEWCASGMAMRVPLFIVEPPFGQTAAYSSKPLPTPLVDALQFAGQAFSVRQRINIETMKYTSGHPWQQSVLKALATLKRLPGGGAMANRVAEMAIRYAVVHHMALLGLRVELVTTMTGVMPAAQDVLTREDLDFGLSIAKYHVDALAYVMGDDNSVSQDQGERFEKMLVFTAREFNKVMDKMRDEGGPVKVVPSTIARYVGSMRGSRGAPKAGEKIMKVTKEEMKEVFDYLVSRKVLDFSRGSYTLTDKWHERFEKILSESEGHDG